MRLEENMVEIFFNHVNQKIKLRRLCVTKVKEEIIPLGNMFVFLLYMPFLMDRWFAPNTFAKDKKFS